MEFGEPAWMTEELSIIRETVRKFIAAEIEPHYEAWESDGIVPRQLWNKLGDQGLLAPDMPERYGGFDGSYEHLAVVMEEFARQGFSTIAGTMLGVHSGIVAHYILNNGTEEQKQKYLPGMASGEIVAAIAMTEPATGSDLQGIKTTAKPDGNGYVVNGSKTFISNGQHCDVVVVVAKTDAVAPGAKGTSLLFVEKDAKGFGRGRNLDKIGLHSSDTSELFFDNVRVSGEAVLGDMNSGFPILMKELRRERLTLATCAMGAIEGALKWTINYIQEREVFGQPVASFQNSRFKIAEMMTEARSLRAFVDECMQLLSNDQLDTATASMVKLKATELQGEITDGCLQLFGGYGYMREFPISRAFVDARVQRIYGGTSEIMKEIIARDMLGR